MPEISGVEFIRIKVFLYKYTPPFTLESQAGPEFTKVDRYSTKLNSEFFTKLDISDFVANYTFNQSIGDNTYSWTLTLQETPITFKDLNTRIKLLGPDLGVENSAFINLAQYESQAKNLNDAEIIRQAKVNRGVEQTNLNVRVGRNLDTDDGIKLSDLIQTYDFISVFTYKNTVPLEDIRGEKKTRKLSEITSIEEFFASSKKSGFGRGHPDETKIVGDWIEAKNKLQKKWKELD